jgi:hypothetical protein
MQYSACLEEIPLPVSRQKAIAFFHSSDGKIIAEKLAQWVSLLPMFDSEGIKNLTASTCWFSENTGLALSDEVHF